MNIKVKCYLLSIKYYLLLSTFLLFTGCVSYRSYDQILWQGHSQFDESITPKEKEGIIPGEIDKFVETTKDKKELTLLDCYALALAYSERLKSAGENYFQSFVDKEKALSLIMPTITFKGQYFRQESSPNAGGLGSSLSPIARSDYWLTFKQPLFSGLKDIYTIRAANISIKSKETMLLFEKTQIFLLILSTFYDILKIEQQISVLTNSLKTREDRLEEMKERRKLGLIRETEVLLVETQVASDRTLLDISKNNIEILRARMEFLIGIPIANKSFKDIFTESKMDSLDTLINYSYKNRKDLQSKQLDIDMLTEKIKVLKGEFFPSLSLSGNIYSKRSGFQKNVDWDSTFLLEFPIFEGGLTRAKLKEAFSQQRQLVHLYNQLKKQIAEEVKSVYYEVKTSESKIEKLVKEVELAQKNYDMLKEEYTQKIATSLELLFADVNLQTAKIKLETERLNRKESIMKLRLIIGEEIWQR